MSALPKEDDLLIGMIRDPLSWEHWPTAKAFLDPALRRADETWDQVESDLSSNSEQLWAVMDGETVIAAAITRIAQTCRGEVTEVYLVGGKDSSRWLAALDDQIEQASRSIGCIAMRAYGRQGWIAPLGKLGWKQSFVAYEKAL